MAKSFNLAVIGGDGIGPEVVAEGLKVLDVVATKYGVTFNKTNYELGAKYWHKTGETLPDAVLDELAKADVILLGAVGDPTVPSGVLERGLLLKLRFAFDHYINLRPAKLHAGVKSPLATDKEIDFIVVLCYKQHKHSRTFYLKKQGKKCIKFMSVYLDMYRSQMVEFLAMI